MQAAARPHWIHCSYHKCLTVYYRRVMDAVFNRCLFWSAGFRHYNSHLRDFYDGLGNNRVVSINNRDLDLERLGRFRISRFIRDPRDLVVSGYFYHKRGAEAWTTIPSPTADDWYFANGCLPDAMEGTNLSFSEYLQSVPVEEGLLAEIEFRSAHFESMARWPEHPDIITLRYEEVLGNEVAAFREIFEHYGFSGLERRLGLFFAQRHAFGPRQKRDPHVRNPSSGQWRQHFTPRVRREFDARFAGLIRQLDYPAD